MILTATITVPQGAAPRLAAFRAIAAAAERGRFDAVLFGGPGIDALPLIVALAAGTRHVGLGAEVPLDHAEPFNVARSFAGADRLTGGRSMLRVGPPARAADFAHAPALDEADRWARAAELLEVARKLWDSWEDAAVILDKAAGLFTDPDRVHRIDHAGPWFQVRGPLNAPRPLQGHPVIVMDDPGPQGPGWPREAADLLVSDHPHRQEPRFPRLLLRVGADATLAQLLAAAGSCDGFDVQATTAAALDGFVDRVVPGLQAHGLLRHDDEAGTLRDRLGLSRPVSRFA